MADLDPRFTFESFVVGPANRLASAAARRAADSPGQSYNPLFIYSASGLGKSHILGAIAHHAEKTGGRRIRYEALEGYLERLTDALEAGTEDDLRNDYRRLDILLMDDVQFLADQREAQEMLLSTLDALAASGRQVVLASDRAPADINGLDARLVSRFSGGLIVDIGPPEFETRMAIVQRRAEEQGQTLGPGVAEAIARVPFKNVRELGGSLNRIFAIQDLEDRSVTADEIPGLFGLKGNGAEAGGDDLDSFVDEISEDLATVVEIKEEPWRKAMREAAETAEAGGFDAARIRRHLDASVPPQDWEATLDGFQADLRRLREIENALEDLDHHPTAEEEQILRDPGRMEEAESLIAAVEERRKPFKIVGAGPDLDGLPEAVPSLAVRAAEQLVAQERPKYNPLYFWGDDTAPAHAVLAAAARSFRVLNPQGHIAVTSITEYASEFIRALSEGVAGAWRERWWTVDLLLVHGLERLSETERAQDEFFHLFEALKRRGARILLTSDRSPGSLEQLDERLRSRFEGGLVLQVEPEGPIPAAMADLTLHDPGTVVAPELPPEEETLAPLEEIGPIQSAPSGEVGASDDEEPEAEGGVWFPSREKVVWNWPTLSDRIVDGLD